MNWEALARSELVQDLGWTLIDSVWQIAIVALALFALLALTQKSSSNLRYALSVSALFLSFLLPVATFISRSQDQAGSLSIERSSDIETNRIESAATDRRDISRPTAANETARGTGAQRLLSSMSALQDYVPQGLPLAVALWLIGVAVSSLRLIGGVWQIHRYKTRDTFAAGGEWVGRFSQLCQKLDLQRSVRLLGSNFVKTPIAVGILKPVIIVPASVFLQIPADELETIIAHELIHIRRYDPLVNIVQNAIGTVLFYHPCVWWMSAQIRREREFAADAAVIEAFEDSHVVYASALANLEEIRHLADQTMPSIVTAANGGNLMLRIRKILQKNAEMNRARSAWSAGLALLLISAVLTLVFSFNSPTFVNAQKGGGERKLAIGFVSIPPLDRSENPPKDSAATAKILVEVLKAHKIPAIGFLNGSQVSDGEKMYPVRAEIAKMWRGEGFEVGVGVYKHIWFYDTPFDEYVANTEKNINIANKLFGQKDLQLHYFSYPYLNTGKSVEDRDRFESWLQGRGLASVKYTIDNDEWMYSYAYDLARNDNDVNTMKEIRTAFLDYMTRMFDHYEAYSHQMFGRDIAQTMVLTPSRLVADTGHDLFGMIEKRGYTFVSMSDAQSDPAYQTAEDFVGKSGISWFERWQMKTGKPLLDEPKIEPGVQRIWDAKRLVPGPGKKN